MRLTWKETPTASAGVSNGVCYFSDQAIIWNGLTEVEETPSTREFDVFIDGVKRRQMRSTNSRAFDVSAISYPYFLDGLYDQFAYQKSINFGFCYRTENVGSVGYAIHLVYNAVAVPTQLGYNSISDSFEPIVSKWRLETSPVTMDSGEPTSYIIASSLFSNPTAISQLEDILYGTENTAPRLPFPDEVIAIFEDAAILRVIDNGDGSFTVVGPDSAISMISDTEFSITWASAVYIDADTYNISSL